MHKQQILQILKLPNRIVTRSTRLLSFKATNPHTQMSRSDHIHIISSIPNSKCGHFLKSFPYHFYNLGFLLGGDSAADDYIGVLAEVQELFFDDVALDDLDEALAGDDDGGLAGELGEVLVAFEFGDLLADGVRGAFIDYEEFHVLD